jgi:hypothetical protein
MKFMSRNVRNAPIPADMEENTTQGGTLAVPSIMNTPMVMDQSKKSAVKGMRRIPNTRSGFTAPPPFFSPEHNKTHGTRFLLNPLNYIFFRMSYRSSELLRLIRHSLGNVKRRDFL